MREISRGMGPLSIDDDVAKARMFHLAQGVLVGLRRYAPEVAIGELIDAAQEFGVSPFALARALVTTAAGGATTGIDAVATMAVRRRWGDMFDSQPSR
ncbi:MAG: transcription antitermination regulator [Mycobacterium sp.]